MTNTAPTVGSIVYLNRQVVLGVPTEPLPAIVTAVLPLAYPGAARQEKLTLFPVDAAPYALNEPFEQGTAPGTWCWPLVLPLARTLR